MVLSLAVGAVEPPLPPAVLTLLPGPCTEFIPWPDGTVWVFQPDGNTTVWDGQGWTTPDQPRIGRVSDALEIKPGEWALDIAGGKEQCNITRVAGKAVGTTIRLAENLKRTALAQSGDGTLWVLSVAGVAYSLTPDGKVTRHELSPTRKDKAFPEYLPLAMDVPGHGLWFWWYGQPEFWYIRSEGPAIPELRVYENSAWRQVPLSASEGNYRTDKLGGVALTGDGDLLCGKPNGRFSLVSPATGVETEYPLVVPDGETCIFLTALRNGDFLAITCDPCEILPKPARAGWRGTLLRIDGKTLKTKVLMAGVDFGTARFNFRGDRPYVETEAGVVLAAANAGLVLVPADGNPARHLDWRNGVPFANIQRLRAGGDLLYLLDRGQGFAICDLRKLMTAEPLPESARWQVETVAQTPVLGPDGAFWYLTVAAPAEVKRVKGDDVQRWSLAQTKFSVNFLWYMTLDTKGRVWLIGNSGPGIEPRIYPTEHSALLLDNGAWRSFLTLKAAYGVVAQEEKMNPGFSVGTLADPCFPAFAGDGRAAYRDERRRVHFTDGTKWDEWTTGDVWDPVSLGFAGVPFYHAGFLTVYHTGKTGFFQLRDGAWKPVDDKAAPPRLEPPPPWRQTTVPKGYPGGVKRDRSSRCFSDNTGAVWDGSRLELYRGLADVWVRWPTLGTPLCMADGIDSVWADGDGGLWFTLSGGDYPRLAHYRMPEAPPVLTWRQPPPTTTRTADVKCTATLDATGTASAFHYRLDEGEWKPVAGAGPAECTIALTGLANGKHTCAVRAFDAQLRSSNVLIAEFGVQRDYAVEIRENLKRLGAADYATREKASRALAVLGPVALPALIEARKSADNDLAWWLDAVIQQINDRTKAAGTTSPEKR